MDDKYLKKQKIEYVIKNFCPFYPCFLYRFYKGRLLKLEIMKLKIFALLGMIVM
ncbi:Hypothetical protein ACI5QO_02247 [Enterococcus faecalis]